MGFCRSSMPTAPRAARRALGLPCCPDCRAPKLQRPVEGRLRRRVAHVYERGGSQNAKHGCPWPPSPTSESTSSTDAAPRLCVCHGDLGGWSAQHAVELEAAEPELTWAETMRRDPAAPDGKSVHTP